MSRRSEQQEPARDKVKAGERMRTRSYTRRVATRVENSGGTLFARSPARDSSSNHVYSSSLGLGYRSRSGSRSRMLDAKGRPAYQHATIHQAASLAPHFASFHILCASLLCSPSCPDMLIRPSELRYAYCPGLPSFQPFSTPCSCFLFSHSKTTLGSASLAVRRGRPVAHSPNRCPVSFCLVERKGERKNGSLQSYPHYVET